MSLFARVFTTQRAASWAAVKEVCPSAPGVHAWRTIHEQDDVDGALPQAEQPADDAERWAGDHQHDEHQEQRAQSGEHASRNCMPPLLDVAVEQEAVRAQLDGLETVQREQVQHDGDRGQRQQP